MLEPTMDSVRATPLAARVSNLLLPIAAGLTRLSGRRDPTRTDWAINLPQFTRISIDWGFHETRFLPCVAHAASRSSDRCWNCRLRFRRRNACSSQQRYGAEGRAGRELRAGATERRSTVDVRADQAGA